MKNWFRILTYGLFLLPFFSNSTSAFEVAKLITPQAQVSLVSETESIQPGQSFWLGLHFQLKEGWHTYWKNPGDSGQPLKIQWSAPEGVEIGELQFPYPHPIPTGALMSYGYEKEVLFLIPGKLSKDFSGNSVTLKSQARWLVCEQVCIPEKGELSLTLPVKADAPQSNQTWQGAFTKARAQLAKSISSPEIRWKSEGNFISLSIPKQVLGVQPGNNYDVSKLRFFPDKPGVIEHAAPQAWHQTEGEILVDLTKSKVFNPNSFEKLTGVVVDTEKGMAWKLEAIRNTWIRHLVR